MVDRHGELTELEGFIHPVAKPQAGDNPSARAVAGHSGTRHGLAPSTLPKEQEQKEFARELAHFIGTEFHRHKFAELMLAAPPEFLGALRGALDRDVQAVVSRSINKDLTHSSIEELRRQVIDRPLH
jgi:protein required for attachment to host cells